jgi:hypothetical protein
MCISMNVVRRVGLLRPFKRKVIVVNIDEVLCPFLNPLLKWRTANVTTATYPHMFAKSMSVPDISTQRLVERFYRSSDFKSLKPIEGSQQGLAYLKGIGYEVYAITGRPSSTRSATEDWLNTHFTHTVDNLILTNRYTQYNIPKVNACRAVGANIIIDDNYDVCAECVLNGLRALNFIGDPMYPWCLNSPLAVNSWTDVRITLMGMEKEPAFLTPSEVVC